MKRACSSLHCRFESSCLRQKNGKFSFEGKCSDLYKEIENLFGRGWLEGDLSEIRFVCFQEGFFGEEGYRVNEVRYDIDDVKGRRVEIILCEYLYLQKLFFITTVR